MVKTEILTIFYFNSFIKESFFLFSGVLVTATSRNNKRLHRYKKRLEIMSNENLHLKEIIAEKQKEILDLRGSSTLET